MMKKILLGVLPCLLCFPLPRAFGWGAVTGFNTHGLIDTSAYEILSRDAAYDAKEFPALDKILAHEGVYYLLGTDGLVSGPGPDSSGKTPFSYHYYNPQTGKGGAPDAAARHFEEFATSFRGHNTDDKAQDFAWGAHFTADVSVVYHVVGMPYEEFIADYTKQFLSGKFILPTTVTGDCDKLSYGLVFVHSDDFFTEAGNIISARDESVDWVDPWYWNGTIFKVKRSSHVDWEMWVRDSIDTAGLGYSDNWDNPVPNFDTYMGDHITQVKQMVKGAAAKTWINTAAFAKESMPPLQEAAKNVATLWRACLTALAVEQQLEILDSDAETGAVTLRVKAANLTNKAPEEAKKAQVRIVVRGAKVIQGELVQDVGSILPGTAIDRGEWQIQAPDLSALRVRVELIASFKKTPDLQYTDAPPVPLLQFDLPKICSVGDPLVFKLALRDAPAVPWEFELGEGDGDWSTLAAAKENGVEVSQTGSIATLKLKAEETGTFTFHARAVAVGTRAVIALTSQTMVCNPKETRVVAPAVRPTSAAKVPAVLSEYQNARTEWEKIKNANPRPENYQQVSDKYQAAYRRYVEFMQNPGAYQGP